MGEFYVKCNFASQWPGQEYKFEIRQIKFAPFWNHAGIICACWPQ